MRQMNASETLRFIRSRCIIFFFILCSRHIYNSNWKTIHFTLNAKPNELTFEIDELKNKIEM